MFQRCVEGIEVISVSVPKFQLQIKSLFHATDLCFKTVKFSSSLEKWDYFLKGEKNMKSKRRTWYLKYIKYLIFLLWWWKYFVPHLHLAYDVRLYNKATDLLDLILVKIILILKIHWNICEVCEIFLSSNL